jgi:glycosyltransferase involved in cell wall biosynthesis
MKHEQVPEVYASKGRSIPIEQALQRSLFVIPSINGAPLLARLLPTLRIPGDLVVVLDQGSSDETQKVCRGAGVECVQLGSPHTYTQACNIGARLARERSAEYLFILNNDIVFLTDVARELLDEMVADPGLAIAAPSQVIIDQKKEQRLLAYRVRWDLSRMRFEHDFEAPKADARRLEADFCELTCAVVRMKAIEEIGFLDDEYGFYHEDADFCFRLRQAGYACAYLPEAQIEHYHSSTFSGELSERKRAFLANNKRRFASKFLGYGVRHKDHKSSGSDSWNIINQNLHPYLHRFGLIDAERPELIFSHPGTEPFDYLYSVWETTQLPSEWLAFKDAYKGFFAPSQWARQVFESAGFRNVQYLPHGAETDVFNPWGAAWRFFDEKTYLWFSHNQHRKGLDVLLAAWRRFFPDNPNARLVIAGTNVVECITDEPSSSRQWRKFMIAEYPEYGISVREVLTPLTTDELASLYRGVDFVVVPSRSEGFGFTVAEALASGTLTIFPGYSATRAFEFDGALMLRGLETAADYSDKGFGQIGTWWEPDVDHLVSLLQEAVSMDDQRRRELTGKGLRLIRKEFTWRNTCMALHRGLAVLQEQKDVQNLAADDDDAVIPAFRDRRDLVEAKSAARIMHGRPYEGGFGRLREIFASDEEIFADFDRDFYLAEYADVAKQGFDPLDHYLRYGWKENRSPSPHMTTLDLMAARPEVMRRLAAGGGDSSLFRTLRKLTGAASTEAAASSQPVAKPGVLLIGYVEASLGIGESLRGFAKSLATTGLPFAVYPFNVNVETRLIGPFMEHRYDRDAHYDVNVFELAADQLPRMFEALGEARLQNSYNILRTAWELPNAPREWAPWLQRMDEIWVPTAFVQQAFIPIYDGPVQIMPHCVDVEVAGEYDRTHFGMDQDRFYFMFSFDYYSMPARKNPLGVLRAFQRAFPAREENVGLIIKSTSAKKHHPRIKAAIAEAAAEDTRIKVIDEVLARDELLSLIRESNCYVSLHRSEGYGLGMAEAMAFGNIVIATDYSGNTDFLSEHTGFPVAYTRRALRFGEYMHADGQSWAEPDEEAAAEAMRRAFYDQEERRRRAAAGQALVKARYGRENVGRLAEARLRQILRLIEKIRKDSSDTIT